jgi:hypothetical protein
VKATAFVTPLFHEYVEAPEPLKVTWVPAHTDWLFPADTVGKAFTVSVNILVSTAKFVASYVVHVQVIL